MNTPKCFKGIEQRFCSEEQKDKEDFQDGIQTQKIVMKPWILNPEWPVKWKQSKKDNMLTPKCLGVLETRVSHKNMMTEEKQWSFLYERSLSNLLDKY